MTTTRRRFLKAAVAAGLATLPASPAAASAAAGTGRGAQSQRRAGDTVLVFAGDAFLTHALAPSDAPARGVVELLQASDGFIVNFEEDLDRLTASVRAARRRADFVHRLGAAPLGTAREVGRPRPEEDRRARRHRRGRRHLRRPRAARPARSRDLLRKPIAHSLANFALQRAEPTPAHTAARLPAGRESVLLRVTLITDRRTPLELIPIVIPADGRPRIAAEPLSGLIAEKMTAFSSALGTDLVTESGYARLFL